MWAEEKDIIKARAEVTEMENREKQQNQSLACSLKR
jgi:hypothetical protein